MIGTAGRLAMYGVLMPAILDCLVKESRKPHGVFKLGMEDARAEPPCTCARCEMNRRNVMSTGELGCRCA